MGSVSLLDRLVKELHRLAAGRPKDRAVGCAAVGPHEVEQAKVLSDRSQESAPAHSRPLDDLLTAFPDQAHGLIELLAHGMRLDTPEDEKYRIAEALTAAVYPKYKFSEYGRVFLDDEAFIVYYQRFMDPGNWHSLDRKYFLREIVAMTLDVEGDAAECGVYKGASAYLICRATTTRGKWTHLFDSWEGLSKPTARDGTYWVRGALRAGETDVIENLKEFDNFTLHRGWIPERFGDVSEKRFCF